MAHEEFKPTNFKQNHCKIKFLADRAGSFLCRWQICAAAMCHLSGHANTFTQSGVRVNGLANVDGIGAHFNGQGHFTNHVTRMRAHHAATQYFAVAMGLG